MFFILSVLGSLHAVYIIVCIYHRTLLRTKRTKTGMLVVSPLVRYSDSPLVLKYVFFYNLFIDTDNTRGTNNHFGRFYRFNKKHYSGYLVMIVY